MKALIFILAVVLNLFLIFYTPPCATPVANYKTSNSYDSTHYQLKKISLEPATKR